MLLTLDKNGKQLRQPPVFGGGGEDELSNRITVVRKMRACVRVFLVPIDPTNVLNDIVFLFFPFHLILFHFFASVPLLVLFVFFHLFVLFMVRILYNI